MQENSILKLDMKDLKQMTDSFSIHIAWADSAFTQISVNDPILSGKQLIV